MYLKHFKSGSHKIIHSELVQTWTASSYGTSWLHLCFSKLVSLRGGKTALREMWSSQKLSPQPRTGPSGAWILKFPQGYIVLKSCWEKAEWPQCSCAEVAWWIFWIVYEDGKILSKQKSQNFSYAQTMVSIRNSFWNKFSNPNTQLCDYFNCDAFSASALGLCEVPWGFILVAYCGISWQPFIAVLFYINTFHSTLQFQGSSWR